MAKRALDVALASLGLLVVWPVLAVVMFLVWRQDRHSPIYWAPRVGKGGKIFRMAKLRSMIWNASSTGVDSTSADDPRITPIGHAIRRYKLDEFTQLWNVLLGDMSMVGPRPNVQRETSLYTEREQGLLSVCPGVTDFSSIVYSDLSEILRGSASPDIAYNQLVRPRKSMLGLFYVEHQTLRMDVQLIWLTVLSLFSRSVAMAGVRRVLLSAGGGEELASFADRRIELTPMAPPGALEIVMTRHGVAVDSTR